MAEKKICGRTYRTTPIPAKQAIELHLDLMRIATKATGRIAAVIATVVEDGDDSLMSDLAATAALGDILSTTKSEEIIDLLDRLVSTCEVSRPGGYFPVDFDEEFTGNIKAVIPVCQFVVKEQLGDFFSASVGGGIFNAVKTALAKQS